jgi:hypothetical protein
MAIVTSPLGAGRHTRCGHGYPKTRERLYHRRYERATRLREQHRQHQSPIFRWAFRSVDLSRQVHVCPRLANRLSRLDALHISEPLWQASKQHPTSPLSQWTQQRLRGLAVYRGMGLCRQRFRRDNQSFTICVICVKTSLNPLAPYVKSFAARSHMRVLCKNDLMIPWSSRLGPLSALIGANISATRRSEERRQRKQRATDHVLGRAVRSGRAIRNRHQPLRFYMTYIV